jgi:hypothetical protein
MARNTGRSNDSASLLLSSNLPGMNPEEAKHGCTDSISEQNAHCQGCKDGGDKNNRRVHCNDSLTTRFSAVIVPLNQLRIYYCDANIGQNTMACAFGMLNLWVHLPIWDRSSVRPLSGCHRADPPSSP